MLSVLGDSESPRESPRLRLFFRSILFPLIVIAALAWLAFQTLRDEPESSRIVYSDLIARAESSPGSIQIVTFLPRKQEIEVTLESGETLETHYASEASQIEFQRLLQEKGVRFDSKGTGSSAWWALTSTLLPFVLLFGFWLFLMNNFRGRREATPRERDRRESPEDEEGASW